MNKDNHLIFEAFKTKWKQTSMDPKQAEAEFGKENVKVTPKGLRNGQDMVEVNVPDEDAEMQHAPHGYPGGITAIQNVLMNELKKRGYELTKISPADNDADAYPTVFMKKQSGPSHNIVEISGMGAINGEHYKDYLKNIASEAEERPSFRYDPMGHLADAAHQIHKILKSNSDDEARTEHLEKMAEIILGPQSEYASVNEYRRILGGVIELLNHHVMTDMN